MRSRKLAGSFAALGIIAMLLGSARPGRASYFQDLYAFKGGADGFAPQGNIAIGANGVIYGVTIGTAFSLTPPSGGGSWTESTIDSSLGFPSTGLVIDANGNLFGATGLINSGSLYELVASGGSFSFSDLWDFGSGHPNPQSADLLLDKSGAIYGTTSDAVNGVPGTIFFFPPGGPLHTLYTFKNSPDGAYPHSALVPGAGGAIFGTTFGGGTAAGADGCGTAFELTSIGGVVSENVIYTFQGSLNGGPDGCRPETNLVRGRDGVLYGTTIQGGPSGNGTFFSLTPPAVPGEAWTEAVLYSFTGFADGSVPATDLVMGPRGILYGAAGAGGSGGDGTIFSGDGTIFSLTPPVQSGGAWTEATIHTFQGRDGLSPIGLALRNGVLYGTTDGGGLPSQNSPSGNGVVFGLVP